MDEIIKFLKSMGLGDTEIKKVLKEVPVDQQGLTGTNVATGVFTKTNPKSKELVKDFPLVVERIGNPFEVNYYKGRSREETIKMAQDNVNFLENEITKLADQILNKNLQLTEVQKINLTKNLETKRKIEKDFETFKTTPDAPVVDIKTGETVTDVETLKEKSGLIAPPTTDLGRIELRNKQMLQKADDFFKSQENVQREEVKRQALLAKQYEGKGYTGGVFGPSGIYRATARDFLLDQNSKGLIKLDTDVVKALEERSYISGGQPLMYPDPIRIMRFHYGDDVFDKIPLDELNKISGARSDILNIMSKTDINPIKAEAPRTPGGYMTPGEMSANIEELKNIEGMIKRREYRFADMTDEQIKNELEHYGSQRTSFEIAFQSDHPEAYEKFIKLNPEKKAEGGAMGLDYLTGQKPPKNGYTNGGRVNFEKGTVPRIFKFLIDKLADEKNFNKTLLEKSSPKAIQDLYIEQYGKLPSAEEIKDIVNKQLQNKGSMETINPKTGEVITPKEPITTVDKKRQLTKEEIQDYEEAIGRDSEQWMSEGTVEEAEKALKKSKAEEAYMFQKYKKGELDPAPGEQTEARMKFLQKKFDEVLATGDRRFITLDEAKELQELQFAFRRKPKEMIKGMSLEEEMNMVLNQYDKSMFIKNEQGMVDVTNPENVRKMALLLQRDHPEIYKRLEEGIPINTLEDFDVTGRKPNAVGGRVGFAEGTRDAPSITLDSHDKAPDNMDKYPVKLGNLELGIMGAMRSGQSTPDPYVKINTADRNFTLRGKYNVPDTGISLLGDIGDVRSRSRVNIDVPQYDYKETFKDVMRLNPYSVGIEYAPDQNKNISLRYNDQGNVTLKAKARFAKGGLGYLMGE